MYIFKIDVVDINPIKLYSWKLSEVGNSAQQLTHLAVKLVDTILLPQ